MTGPIVALDHVQVAAPAGSEAEARHFYGGLLGLEEVAKPPLLAARGGVWFRVGAHELHIGVAADFTPATKAHAAFRAASHETLVQLAATLEAHGIDVNWADRDEVPELTRCFVRDPWGNRLELLA